MYDFTKLNMDTKAIEDIIVKKGRVLICKEDIQIVYPKRFDDRDFTSFDSNIRIMGIFAFVDTKGNYAVHNIPNRLSVRPSITETIMINGEHHVLMTFYKDSIISDDTTMVMDTSFLNSLYNEFIVLGKVPSFFGYLDLLKTFKLTLQFNGSPVGKYNTPLELLISLIARDINDKKKMFRYTGKKTGKPGEIYWVGLSNVHYAVTSLMSKLGGGYGSQAIFSAVNNRQEMSSLEELILT